MTLERMNALLRRAGIDPATGLVDDSSARLARIIAEDKRDRWPIIERERSARHAKA